MLSVGENVEYLESYTSLVGMQNGATTAEQGLTAFIRLRSHRGPSRAPPCEPICTRALAHVCSLLCV